MLIRYSRWDGSQSLPDLDADDVLAAMADDLMADGDPRRALERLLRRGFRTRAGEPVPGLGEQLERLRQARQALLREHELGDVLAELREQLRDVVETERAGIERRLAERAPDAPGSREALAQAAAARRERLDALPSDVGGAIRALQDYPFMDPEAWQKFQALMMRLRQEIAESLFGRMKQGLEGLGPGDVAALGAMLGDLNRLLREGAARGGRPDARGFLDRWGGMFPGVGSLDELLDRVARDSAQLQSLLDSLPAAQRRELESLQEALLGDPALREAMTELGEHLARLGFARRAGRYRMEGDVPLSLREALRVMGALHDLDRAEETLREAERSGGVDQVDARALERALGEPGAQALEVLRRLAEALEAAGYLETRGARWTLTPRAIRKIAQRALAEVLGHLGRDRVGRHQVDARGSGGDRTDEFKPYEFGDPFLLHLRETLWSALRREGGGLPLRLAPSDFTVHRTELSARCATALVLDMSRSMLYRDCWTAAKKVALALHALIRAQYPGDALYVIGFSLYARELPPDEVPAVVLTDRHYGTNMQHALALARRLLGRHRGGNRQVVMITDGEPTAHLEGDQAHFDYPTTRRTWELTQAEVRRCGREGITINTFMLEDSPGLVRFVSEMSRINRGRAFFVQPDRLGEYVLVDYLARKQKRVG
ncbi:MAG TPA: VWA domain-containing protein [Methylomirabilota bacterium]|nr:VWA domain-containing protein [Methylomirabilota bacterium]